MEKNDDVREALGTLPPDRTGRRESSPSVATSLISSRIVILGMMALAFGAWMMVVKARHDRLLAVALGGTSGLLFVVAGIVARVRRPDNRTGTLMVLTAFAFFAEDLQLLDNSTVYTVGILLYEASLPFVVYLLLAFPSGRLSSRLEQVIVAGAFAHAFAFSLLRALFSYPVCLGCRYPSRDLLSVHHSDFLIGILDRAAAVTGLALAATIVAVLARRWARATPPMRRVLAPVLGIGLLGAVASVVDAGVRTGFASYSRAGFHATMVVVIGLTFWALPVAFLVGVLRFRLGRAGVGALLHELRESRSPGELARALARALGDPSVEIAVADPASGLLVDAEGAAHLPPGPGSGRATTLLEREGRTLGVLIHDEALSEDADMVAAVASVAALALDNERLAAEVRSQLTEVQRSRARIVEAADAERRRVERDLHDGAQQRLVTLALRLRMARRRLGSATDPSLDQLLNESAAELDEALRQLRELARGIHPAVLTESGLAAAIESLADRATSPIQVTATPGGRLAPAVEIAAYYVVAEALTNAAKHARANVVTVKVDHEAGQVHVEIADDGVGGADPAQGSGLVGLHDRVAAVGGRLEVLSAVGHGTTVRATIPAHDRARERPG